jgi:hypothetical protein
VSQGKLQSPEFDRVHAPARTPVWGIARRWIIQPVTVLLLVLAVLLSRSITRGEPFFGNDETRHVMDGVFVRDLIADRPFSHPVEYARNYYAKYPAVAVLHWPPLFPSLEAILFLIFGPSFWASRVLVEAFALLGAYFWYRIAERFGLWWRAFLSAIIFCLLPTIMLFESVVMLEIPHLALCLATIYFWLHWVESKRMSEFWKMTAFGVAALLTYQASVFLLFLLGLDFVLARRFKLLRSWQVAAGVAMGLALVLSWYAFAIQNVTMTYQRAIGHHMDHVMESSELFFYPGTLPGQLGFLLLILALVGIVYALLKAARQYYFLFVWIASAYICFTAISEKSPRHIFIWLPPLVYFALLGVEAIVPRRRWNWLPYTALAIYILFGAFRFQRPQLFGLQTVARFVLAQPESDLVYYQGALNGDFIFNVRRLDPQKQRMVARDKQVEVTEIVYAHRPVIQTASEFVDLFRTWGIRYAIVESMDTSPDLKWTHAVLRSGQFDLVRTFPIQGDADLNGDQIEVYRYRGQLERTDSPVTIPMMTLHDDIRVNLNELIGRPWPK